MTGGLPKWSGAVGGAISIPSVLERRSTLHNHGETASWASSVGGKRECKFFSRGGIGFIDSIEVYCRDAGASGGTISVYITPFIGRAHLHLATITVPAGGEADWRAADFNLWWNYDRLLVVLVTSSTDIQFAHDGGEPYDRYTRETSTADWEPQDSRIWIKSNYSGETPGDMPISGIVNAISIPNVSQERQYKEATISADTETTLFTVRGVGYCDHIIFYVPAHADSHQTEIRVYCDGTNVYWMGLDSLNAYGITASTPGTSLLKYDVDGDCSLLVTHKLEFQHDFSVRAYNPVDSVEVHAIAQPKLLV